MSVLPPSLHPCTLPHTCRADIKQYVGLPPPEAIAQMLDSSLQVTSSPLPAGRHSYCLQELVRVGLVSPPDNNTEDLLMEVAELCHSYELSGTLHCCIALHCSAMHCNALQCTAQY